MRRSVQGILLSYPEPMQYATNLVLAVALHAAYNLIGKLHKAHNTTAQKTTSRHALLLC